MNLPEPISWQQELEQHIADQQLFTKGFTMRGFSLIAITLTIIAITLALCSPAHAQCANGQCFQPSYGSGYSTGFYGGFTFAEPAYSAPVVVTETRPVFTTSIVNGQHRAVNNMTGAVWTWNPYMQAWRYDGNRNQPVIVEQRVYAPSPYQSSQRCQCGCGCLNCRCGR